ncbi:DUF1289 domain-containing protein [Diaphorobacter aerolatus]|uniref:DUF1289 domain-containing protein n=1 Tax=Diaphorobacter aerolatus TaxID=1288495 RepID=A0A7H0GHC6_9BURK|nr:DUF1289 domain-containing protein [Diaphorobacter aerolatus]QNP47692.1 DUF1289 domain-containing protein [Diaphorobacter aerolatus]
MTGFDNLLLEARALDVADIGHFDAAYDGVVDSPCVNVCRMTADRSHCEGCFRTIDEIRRWSKADAADRRTIWIAALRRAEIELPKALA